MPDPETKLPPGPQLELPLDFTEETLYGLTAQLALFWAVKGDALYRVVLAAPQGWDDEVCLSTWPGAVEIPTPVRRRLVWPLSSVDTTKIDNDDLDDVVESHVRDEEQDRPDDAS